MNKQIRIVLSLYFVLCLLALWRSAAQAQAAPVIPPQPHEYVSTNGDTVSIQATDSGLPQ